MNRTSLGAPRWQAPQIDYRWHTFGRWLAMGPSTAPGKEEFRRCQCQCKAENPVVDIHYLALLEGRAQSCGCDYREQEGRRAWNFHDITGQQFHQWLVLTRVPKEPGDEYVWWMCQCRCGTAQHVRTCDLRSGHSTRCYKCARRKPMPTQWLHGTHWFVNGQAQEYVRDATGHVRWLATCRCGRKRYVQGTTLRNQESTSCGCRGKGVSLWATFGYLVVIGTYSSQKDTGRGTVRCQCLCGYSYDVLQDSLLTGKTTSCGCRGKYFAPGERRGALTILHTLGHGRWWCQCDCGKERDFKGAHIRKGDVASCGQDCPRKLGPRRAPLSGRLLSSQAPDVQILASQG